MEAGLTCLDPVVNKDAEGEHLVVEEDPVQPSYGRLRLLAPPKQHEAIDLGFGALSGSVGG